MSDEPIQTILGPEYAWKLTFADVCVSLSDLIHESHDQNAMGALADKFLTDAAALQSRGQTVRAAQIEAILSILDN